MLAILNSLNAHYLPIFQPMLMILVSKFKVYGALSDKTYLPLGLLSRLKIDFECLNCWMEKYQHCHQCKSVQELNNYLCICNLPNGFQKNSFLPFSKGYRYQCQILIWQCLSCHLFLHVLCMI